MRNRLPAAAVVALLAGLATLVALGLGLDARRRAQRARQELAFLESQAAADRQSIIQCKRLSLQLRSLAGQSQKMAQAVPEDPDVGSLYERLNHDLTARRVASQEVQVQPTLTGSRFSRVPLTLRFRGGFPATFAFLQQIESYPRIIRADRIEVTAERHRPGQPQLVTLELSTFHAPAKESRP